MFTKISHDAGIPKFIHSTPMRISNGIALTWSIDPSRHIIFKGSVSILGQNCPRFKCHFVHTREQPGPKQWVKHSGEIIFSYTIYPLTFLPSEPRPLCKYNRQYMEPHGFHALSKQNIWVIICMVYRFFFEYCNEKCLISDC